MSLYNMIFGMNPQKDMVLSFVGLREVDVDRFRDCSVDFDNRMIEIYARTGGGNREDYSQTAIKETGLLVSDSDDDFDCTYNSMSLKFPDGLADDIMKMQDIGTHGIPASIIKNFNEVTGKVDDSAKRRAEYERQIKHIQSCKDKYLVMNGHTVIPLSDSAFEQTAKMAEESEFGFIAYWHVLPIQTTVYENCSRWKSLDKNKPDTEIDIHRFVVDAAKDWPIDEDLLDRWRTKYAEKYPNIFKDIDEYISRNQAAA